MINRRKSARSERYTIQIKHVFFFLFFFTFKKFEKKLIRWGGEGRGRISDLIAFFFAIPLAAARNEWATGRGVAGEEGGGGRGGGGKGERERL